MYQSRHLMLYSLLTTLGVALLIGWLLGYPISSALLAVLGWAGFQIWQFSKVMAWLKREDGSEPPLAKGAWGDLLDGLYRMQRTARNKEHALQQVIKRFQHSSAALSDAVVIIDKRNNLEWWNRSAERLLGFKARADRGKSVLNLLRDPRFIRYYRKGNYSESLELPSPRHQQMDLLYTITLFGEGDRLLVARDITRLKRLEQTRQTFVANASHELRTPLTVMRGYIETFLDQELPPPILRGLSQMEKQTQRMEGLVRDLLLLSRLESSQHVSDEHPVDIQQMLQQIQRDAQVLSGENSHHIELRLEQGYDLLGQELELHSAFSNLVFNAVRYTPAGSHILISWQVDNKGGKLCVEDNGLGIESIHIPRLTERFYRVDEGRSSESGGTGLGLSIVKHVLVRHGAKLSIKSKVGKGSTFCCHFPSDMLIPSEMLDREEVDESV
ncbi:phosphate regulon sensor histidine kinase PhoR [Nitrincola alkalilacustris]|uniref:phosphate regulon sensor histidine kinase PhoR n=1 Tax=Nitrincola alkalilacustris TaxID=1571224 RepID=UPI00124E7833|nr:phosphate regulon sensor histidine kinase PhoR [Nitrincola alkalilacustris]